ncbi:MAG: hypothetical protein JO023_24195 [Chloroflexi bacterium]|nr:hypothetical protein [Chloroflexota bacterium]
MALARVCTRCRRVLDETKFNFKNRARGIRSSHCKSCSRAYVREHYQRNIDYYVAKARKRSGPARLSVRAKLLAYLLEHPCIDCGEADPVVLDFDHVDAATKLVEVAVLVRNLVGWRRIEAEIAKCEVRCANCHRRRTALQFRWHKLTRP